MDLPSIGRLKPEHIASRAAPANRWDKFLFAVPFPREISFLKRNKFLTPMTAAVAIYFFSGACSLTYEIIWQRLLKLVLGNTTYATTITVAVFMGGLALGALLVRKRADAIKNKLLVYGVIELVVAVFALLTPVILRAINMLYVTIYQSWSPGPTTMLVLQIVVSSATLAIPTILMGTTLPLLASLVVRSAGRTGWETGILYSVNTFGALSGVGVTGYYAIRVFGVYQALLIAAALNALIALIAIMISRGAAGAASPSVEATPTASEPLHQPKKGMRAAVLTWLFLAGFVALGYEIVWVRTVIHLLKAEIYTFSSVLCIYLFGYAAGVLAGALLARIPLRQIEIFSLTAPLLGLCGILYLPLLSVVLDNRTLWNTGILRNLLSVFGYLPHLYLCAIFFFVPSFLMGVCFPLLVQADRDLSLRTGNTVSRAYGYNTIGCVLGAVTTGFVLIPAFGVQTSMMLLGLLAVTAGLSAVVLSQTKGLRIAGILLPALVLAAAFMQPRDIFGKWVNKCEGKGTYDVKLLDVKEGITTTASVHQYSDGSRVISTAGVNVAGDALALRQTQKFQGHFPVIMHGGARSVLTVGFGSGELTKTLTLHGIPDITCVEISPEMPYLSKKYFSHINLGRDLEKYVKMVYMDAKNYLHLTNRKFDVIENDCIWPGTFAESSSLYTKEYFLDARDRLNDGGLFSTWLTLDLPRTTLLSIIRTFSGVFENTLFIYPHHAPDRHILLMGREKKHAFDYGSAEREFEKEKVKESLALIGIGGLNDLLGCILADEASLAAAATRVPVNSDYFPFVEFDMNRTLLINDPRITWKNLGFMLRNTQRADFPRLLSFEGIADSARTGTLASLARNQEADESLLESFCLHTPEEQLSLVEGGLKIVPDHKNLLKVKRILLTGKE